MPFQSRVYRILVASPSDVGPEREAVVNAIHDWNYLNAAERNITLLPLRWETHTTPQLGDRPQAIINRQIGDKCDALIGIFWTRIGSPTGVADSGTLEEIEEAINAGKPAMLYFSTAPQTPDLIDTSQLERLRQFREKIRDKGLIQPYGSLAEFRDLLSRHIENQVRNLAASEKGLAPEDAGRSTTADIQIGFDKAMQLTQIGDDTTRASTSTNVLRIKDPENLPDFQSTRQSTAVSLLGGSGTNTNFYRDYAGYVRDSVAFKKLVLDVSNLGSIGARDVYFDISIVSDKPITVASETDLKLQLPAKTTGWPYTAAKLDHEQSPGWLIGRDVGAVQPQRVIHWSANALIAAWEPCSIDIRILVYADIFAAPVLRMLKLDWSCTRVEVTAEEFVRTVDSSGTAAA